MKISCHQIDSMWHFVNPSDGRGYQFAMKTEKIHFELIRRWAWDVSEECLVYWDFFCWYVLERSQQSLNDIDGSCATCQTRAKTMEQVGKNKFINLPPTARSRHHSEANFDGNVRFIEYSSKLLCSEKRAKRSGCILMHISCCICSLLQIIGIVRRLFSSQMHSQSFTIQFRSNSSFHPIFFWSPRHKSKTKVSPAKPGNCISDSDQTGRRNRISNSISNLSAESRAHESDI